MAEHFGEPYNPGMCDGCCDNCANANANNKTPPKDVTEDAESILKLLDGSVFAYYLFSRLASPDILN